MLRLNEMWMEIADRVAWRQCVRPVASTDLIVYAQKEEDSE